MRRSAGILVTALCGALLLSACDDGAPPLTPTGQARPAATTAAASTASPQVQARIEAARAAYRAGNFQQALSEAQEGIKLDNRNADAHYLAGNAFNQLGGITADAGTRASLFQNAVTSYQRAIELDPRKDEALTNLATVYYQNGQLDDAQKRIEQALAINPTDATSHYVLGTIFLQRSPGTAGETTDKAAKEFEAAIKSDPNFSAAYTGLATVYLFRADFKNALVNAKKGVDLRGAQQDPFALWALAQAQCGTGDTANGSKTLAAVLAFNVPDARFRGEVQKLQAGCK
jgi:tetratricopeptide (TPR) repeat protein